MVPPPSHQARARARALASFSAGKDALAQAAGPQARVQVHPGDATGAPPEGAQHFAQGVVVPGRRGAAEEHAVGVFMLPLRDGRLVARHAVGVDVGRDGGLVLIRGRPLRGQQQVVDLAVSLVDGQGPAEVVEVAVQVHVFMRGAPRVREPWGLSAWM